MPHRSIPRLAAIAAISLAAATWTPGLAPAASRDADRIWQIPDFASRGIAAIALLPPGTYDNSVDARATAQSAFEQVLRSKGYRWVGWTFTHDAIVAKGGDSLFKAIQQALLKQGRLDSLQAPLVSSAARARAILSVRIDRYDKVEIGPMESGTPSMTVQLHAALVDSTGALLWSASGSETADGPYREPVQGSHGLEGAGALAPDQGLPTYRELLLRMLTRWGARFPAFVAAPAAP